MNRMKEIEENWKKVWFFFIYYALLSIHHEGILESLREYLKKQHTKENQQSEIKKRKIQFTAFLIVKTSSTIFMMRIVIVIKNNKISMDLGWMYCAALWLMKKKIRNIKYIKNWEKIRQRLDINFRSMFLLFYWKLFVSERKRKKSVLQKSLNTL